MKIMLIGCGAVGLGIAAAIYDSGENPVLIANGQTYDAIKSGGIERRGIFKAVKVGPDRVRVFKNAEACKETGFDYIIVASKTTASAEIADELGGVKDILAPNGKIILFQNGFGTEKPFLRYFDKESMCAGIIITGFERPQRNVSVVTVHSAPALIGCVYGSDGGTFPLAAAIDKGGLPCMATSDIQKTIWSKMLYNCTLNPLGALLGTNYGGLAKSPDAVYLMDKIIEEIFSVMKAAGYKTNWENAEEYKRAFYGKILPPTYGHRASTLQDMERKIKTEIDTLNGAIVELGTRYAVPTPVNSMICRLVKAKESLYLYNQ